MKAFIGITLILFLLQGCSPYHGITQENIEKSLIACASMGGLKAIEIRGYAYPFESPTAICKNGYEILIGGNSK